MRAIRVRTMMAAVAVVAGLLALGNEAIIRVSRTDHARFHAGRADWFAAQARAYRGDRPGVADQCRRLAAWHHARAEQYRRSRRYDHEAEMKQDLAQTLLENSVDRTVTVDFQARRRVTRGQPPWL